MVKSKEEMKKNIQHEIDRKDWCPENVRLITKGFRSSVDIRVDLFKPNNQRKINNLVYLVCRINNIQKASLFSRSRLGKIIPARQIIMYVLVVDFEISLVKTGQFFDRGHDTVLSAKRNIQGLIDIKDKQTIEDLKLIRELLN